MSEASPNSEAFPDSEASPYMGEAPHNVGRVPLQKSYSGNTGYLSSPFNKYDPNTNLPLINLFAGEQVSRLVSESYGGMPSTRGPLVRSSEFNHAPRHFITSGNFKLKPSSHHNRGPFLSVYANDSNERRLDSLIPNLLKADEFDDDIIRSSLKRPRADELAPPKKRIIGTYNPSPPTKSAPILDKGTAPDGEEERKSPSDEEEEKKPLSFLDQIKRGTKLNKTTGEEEEKKPPSFLDQIKSGTKLNKIAGEDMKIEYTDDAAIGKGGSIREGKPIRGPLDDIREGSFKLKKTPPRPEKLKEPEPPKDSVMEGLKDVLSRRKYIEGDEDNDDNDEWYDF